MTMRKGEPKNTKKFGGKPFKNTSTHGTKAHAQKWAKVEKKHGAKGTRIVKYRATSGDTRYALYTRKS